MNSSLDGSQLSKATSLSTNRSQHILQVQRAQLDVISRSVQELFRLGQGEVSSDRELVSGGSGTSSGTSTPVHVIHPSLGESWLVTPPPCFTAGGPAPQGMPTSPMENLLIEHPSMSVYGPRGRPHSAGQDSEESVEDTRPGEQAGRAVAPRQTPHRPRTITTAKASLQAQVMATRSMQRAHKKHEQRQHTRHAMQRSNRLQHYIARTRRNHALHPSGRSNDRKTHQHYTLNVAG